MSEPIYAVYGAAGCGCGIMPMARLQLQEDGINPGRLVFIDDGDVAGSINGHQVLGYEEFLNESASNYFIAIAIADSDIRKKIAAQCDGNGVMSWSVRASNIVLMDDVNIGDGALLSPFVSIASNVRIGRYFHGNLYSYVEHDCEIGDFVTFAPGVKCNGNIVIEDQAYIGAGAILRQGTPSVPLRIGRGSTVGMGAVVTRDVAAHETVVGNPARPLRRNC